MNPATHNRTDSLDSWGRHFQELTARSTEFARYRDMFEPKLEHLYKIEYSNEFLLLLDEMGPKWKEELVFHCTGNCECLAQGPLETGRQSEKPEPSKVACNLWCKRPQCPIQGILKHGFLLKHCGLHQYNWRSCRKAHFVTSHVGESRWAGIRKCGTRQYLAHFICKVRNMEMVDVNTYAVYADTDILPVYLALVPV
ncbi:hypothetical protein BGZ99_002786 [Dissophora globulifera]|uniref:Uncharacterized protein n=1 Tax=Dissophora globulifera TaxID=979702 RepID=A0A9P6RRT6_9FUNG|nr:hypothetical protein BGZ99_002786 [Dissophora globulifera]